jgi:hypothetical protein
MNFSEVTFDIVKLLLEENINPDLLNSIDIEELRHFCLDQMEIENLDEKTTRDVLFMLPLVMKNISSEGKNEKLVEIVKLLSFFAGVEKQSIRDEALKALLIGLFGKEKNKFSVENLEKIFD